MRNVNGSKNFQLIAPYQPLLLFQTQGLLKTPQKLSIDSRTFDKKTLQIENLLQR